MENQSRANKIPRNDITETKDSGHNVNTNILDCLEKFLRENTPNYVVDRYAQSVEVAKHSNFEQFDSNIVVLDTETTGLSFNHDELIQIAAARMTQGKISDWFVTFVNPGKPIPDDISHLTGIFDTDVFDAPSPDAACEALAEFVGDAIVVAHNKDFDKHFTTAHPGGYPLLNSLWIDSLQLARIAVPRMKSHRLIDLVTAFGATNSTHRADDDVAATCELFRILLAAIDLMPTDLLVKISQLATAEDWPEQVIFEYFSNRHQEEEKAKLFSLHETRKKSLSYLKKRDTQQTTQQDIQRAAQQTARQLMQQPARQPVQQATQQTSHHPTQQHPDRQAQATQESLQFPTDKTIEEAFAQTGIVNNLYEQFEERFEQKQMALAVNKAFRENDNLVVEAGTGVGKSIAYLLPMVYAARANRIPFGVATKTNTLLDQLVYKELPALAKNFDNLTYAPLKGIAHYACLRKVSALSSSGAPVREVEGKDVSTAPYVASLLSYIEQTIYDDIDSLKVNSRVLPRFLFTTKSNDCLRRKCPFHGKECFSYGARLSAETADIVITNHTLLLCDLLAKGGLLPDIKYWVIDEAHNIEQETREVFSPVFSVVDMTNLADRLSCESVKVNPLLQALRAVEKSNSQETATLAYALTKKAIEQAKQFALVAFEVASATKKLLYFDTEKKSNGYEFFDLWINSEIRNSDIFSEIKQVIQICINDGEKLIKACQDIVAYLENIDNVAQPHRELASSALSLKEMLKAADTFFINATDEYAYSVMLSRKKDHIAEKATSILMQVEKTLKETLFEQTNSVVFTSATITVDNKFDNFIKSIGLTKRKTNLNSANQENQENQENQKNQTSQLSHANQVGAQDNSSQSFATTIQLNSSFNYDEAMTIYVASDMSEPNSSDYLSDLQQFLAQVHIAKGGSILTLFTNRREMEKTFDVVKDELKEHELRLVCQKWGVSTKGLRDDFLTDEHLSLFALKSFWEGFDAPGSTLKGVIIPKLPFAKPSDPLSCERASRDNSAWHHYVMPSAVLEVKQAVGRLIRTSHDKGFVLFADSRLISKSYGKVFLNSMPSQTIKILTREQIVSDILDSNN